MVTEEIKLKVIAVMSDFTNRKTRLDIQHACDLTRYKTTQTLKELREDGIVKRRTKTVTINSVPGKAVVYWLSQKYLRQQD